LCRGLVKKLRCKIERRLDGSGRSGRRRDVGKPGSIDRTGGATRRLEHINSGLQAFELVAGCTMHCRQEQEGSRILRVAAAGRQQVGVTEPDAGAEIGRVYEIGLDLHEDNITTRQEPLVFAVITTFSIFSGCQDKPKPFENRGAGLKRGRRDQNVDVSEATVGGLGIETLGKDGTFHNAGRQRVARESRRDAAGMMGK